MSIILAFPKVCYSFKGPHSLDCLTTMWYASGCLDDGYNYPAVLRPSDLAELNSMNLM